MKNQVNYFEKVMKIFRELKEEHPDIEISKHYALATDGGNFSLTDKELFLALQKHKGELDINTLSDKDLQKVIDETDELFKEVDDIDPLEEDDPWHREEENY